mmetsp:Transcript_10190/g.21592  ORF Transcript_10190/g.21592 Transcript_10190/m.21592 type:complete len:225 (+) Transcript_10190:199-873(+)
MKKSNQWMGRCHILRMTRGCWRTFTGVMEETKRWPSCAYCLICPWAGLCKRDGKCVRLERGRRWKACPYQTCCILLKYGVADTSAYSIQWLVICASDNERGCIPLICTMVMERRSKPDVAASGWTPIPIPLLPAAAEGMTMKKSSKNRGDPSWIVLRPWYRGFRSKVSSQARKVALPLPCRQRLMAPSQLLTSLLSSFDRLTHCPALKRYLVSAILQTSASPCV